MRRRDFITFVGGTAASWPFAARAQQSGSKHRLGLLLALSENDAQAREYVAAFVQSLRERGWLDGSNIQIDYRWAGVDVLSIRRAGVELIDLKPNVILAQSGLTLAPLQQLTTNIPIVFLQVVDPVGSGFVTSMAQPGGNLTGVAVAEFSTAAKMLEVLKEVAPQVTRVAVIYNPVQAPQVGMWHAIEAAAPSLSVQASAFSAGNAEEITRIVEGFASQPGSGVIVLPNPITIANRGLDHLTYGQAPPASGLSILLFCPRRRPSVVWSRSHHSISPSCFLRRSNPPGCQTHRSAGSACD
jgi:putative ABC transport system substrate-binding protein